MVVVHAYLKTPIDRQDAVESFVRTYASHVKGEEGNISFEIATNGNGDFYFWEKFENEAAFEVHKKTEHFKNWRNFYEPFLIDRNLEVLQNL